MTIIKKIFGLLQLLIFAAINSCYK